MIPLYVWPIFVLLLIGGLKARKENIVHLAMFLIPPLFFGWTFYTFFGKYGHSFLAVTLWFICSGTGLLLGFLHMQRINLHFINKKVKLPGSWLPLMLSMSIFASKFSIGVLESVYPEYPLLILEVLAALVIGVLMGRGTACLVRYTYGKLL